MKVLTVYAHHDPRSFCHGVLERFTAGLADAGHTSDVVDLYAINFDPVFRDRDVASSTSVEIPEDILELMDPAQRVLNSCRGPVQRFLASHAMRGKSHAEVAAMIRSRMPKDVLAQQQRVAAARLGVHRTGALLQLSVDPQGVGRRAGRRARVRARARTPGGRAR